MPAFEQIRRDVDGKPGDAVSWEAACLKDVASLLENLKHAQSEWQALSTQLSEAKAALAQERRAREDLGTTRREADALREQAGRTAFAESAAAAALERVQELERRVDEARAQADAAESELVRTRERLATAQRERDVLAENEQACAGLKAETAELRTRLKRAEGARKELDEERDRSASIERELERTRKDVALVRKEHEEQMVLVCDLRVKLNRLEKERDEAAERGKQKLRATLEKIHEALDAAGAPRGDELSYGDRIRRLGAQLEQLRGAS